MPSFPSLSTPGAAARPRQALSAGWLASLALVLAWDISGADLTVMRWIGTSEGFPWRHTWLLEQLLHDHLRQLGTAGYVLMWVWALWPARWRFAATSGLWLPRGERLVLVLLVALSLLTVNLVKISSHTSCPWELAAFGGQASHVSHWNLWTTDGGSGRCFPGGHASSAFAFFSLCLPWLETHAGGRNPRAGWQWLGAVVLFGLLAGGVQTLRGAHYPSHTAWTGLVCAGVSLLGWRLAKPWLAR